ncbi:uncharacterized protein TRAVEDRAFT_49506 [Trametes versicolor FP-101664 SS1]|uniref:uncharacterized protein n=1 Tax=Trametes versicolor (strain FP-101664) TaxID=717944 RepID=UPI0004623291|nr:uncharacterized protein TRAVEDRAFT_49506 [Trametes versicolor FP-101664 SS1]EIW56686.1 hypothetical protein TRAVEDRAFT_49506 [Trametes versicolor FP-101664 SS1]
MFPMLRRCLPVAIIYALLAQHIAAQTTLYIPGLDPQPVTAAIVGVDAPSSSTTWRIGPRLTSGIFTEAVSSFHSDGEQTTQTMFTVDSASGSAVQVGTAGVTITYKTVQAGQTTGTGNVAAATLYIPFFDPQPITADIEGVDASGHTTWRIGPGVPSGTLTDDSDLFVSATLVAGPTDLHLVENDTELGFAITADCGLNGAVAVCTVDASAADIVSTTIITTTANAFDVQVATTAQVTLTDTAATATATSSDDQRSGGLRVTTTGSVPPRIGTSGAPSAATDSGSAMPSATGGSNGAERMGSSVFGLGMSVALVAMWFA